MTQMYLGWHFCDMNGDGEPVLRDGTPLVRRKTYEYKGRLVMCKSGYHSSVKLLDALKYAPGDYLCRTLSSNDLADTDKHVSRYRAHLVGINAEMILHEFAARIAYCALLAERKAGREPDPRSWRAVSAKMAWCRGEIDDEALRTARKAAESTAWSAASLAGWSASLAAWLAAESAAWSAAWSAESTASSAASTASAAEWAALAALAARSAARADAEKMLLEMLPPEVVNPALLEPKQ